MKITFKQLNDGWNAEPNAPDPAVKIEGKDLLLTFTVNPFLFPEFDEEEIGVLRFVDCVRYRLGPTNDEGWFMGQCRFSKLAPSWGEFYLVEGDEELLGAPADWQTISESSDPHKHFLFYFRDDTFECVARQCIIEPRPDNSLQRTGKKLPTLTSSSERS